MPGSVSRFLSPLFSRGILRRTSSGVFLDFSFVHSKVSNVELAKRDFDDVVVLNCCEKSFEYWVSQDKFVPPWELNWFQLRENQLLLLRSGLLISLIKRGVKKFGSLNALCKACDLAFPPFLYVLRGSSNMVSVFKLKRLALALSISYDYFNAEILELRKSRVVSIREPNFPIDLCSEAGGALLGAVSSDGCVYCDAKARGILRTKYSTNSREDIATFIRHLNAVFGDVHFNEEFKRNCYVVRVGTGVVGQALGRAGAIVGHKAKLNKGVPWLVREGSLSVKKGYLGVAFGDEASVGLNRTYAYVLLTRSRQLATLSEEQREKLTSLEPLMRSSQLPTGHIIKRISINSAVKADGSLSELLLDSAPEMLLGESGILREFFGIPNHIYPGALSKTELGTYSLSYTLALQDKKSLFKFVDLVGFSCKRKQEKLCAALNSANRDCGVIETLQYAGSQEASV